MDNDSFNKWTCGIVAPGVGLAWGIYSLISGEIVIPIQRFKSLPIYEHIPLHGWPAIFISAALISTSLCMHFNVFWSRYPKSERFSYLASVCTAWAAGILLATGIIVWLIATFQDFCR
jgi:hypothetical protein